MELKLDQHLFPVSNQEHKVDEVIDHEQIWVNKYT